MTPKLRGSAGRVQFGVIEKLTSACYFKIARETMLLLVNNIKENIRKKKYTQYDCTAIGIAPLNFFLKNFKFTPITS